MAKMVTIDLNKVREPIAAALGEKFVLEFEKAVAAQRVGPKTVIDSEKYDLVMGRILSKCLPREALFYYASLLLYRKGAQFQFKDR